MKKYILFSFLLITGSMSSQAWDDVFDSKYSVGISFQNKGKGVEFGYDVGVLDYLSVELLLDMFFKQKNCLLFMTIGGKIVLMVIMLVVLKKLI
ncbi:hypothetical protein HNP99_000218 [Flavobacterium sp. 28A]|uniref:hypothetical protein n=1 Tax=Flavobacterium sp. 28A TaxID=2735895 RepID=UPI00156F064E|nr:hypothetical protein [Flavobacterium sp. 28A]NRT13893.1 hypothetical protein [Flavobacterium sp. 28A]